MTIKIRGTRVLRELNQSFPSSKLVCLEGGSRSSKTWSIFQLLITRALEGRGETYTIARAKLTWVRSTLLKDFQELKELYNLEITPDINPNRQEQVYYLNGTEFAFFGLDYPEKLHGRKQDIFWINETMEADRKSFDQLEMRTRIGAILDYNPYDDGHWVFDLHQRGDVKVLKSTMLDNPFLEQAIRDKILSYEPTPENIKAGTADSFMWEVYGLGNKARLQGVVFENWGLIDGVPEEARLLGYGLDFGYTNDPTALIGVYMYDNEIIADQLLYEPGLTNEDITERLKGLEFTRREEIFADSAEPKSIEEIYRKGFNIKGVKKGADSILFGIDILKQYKINITKRSIDLESEFRKYKWTEDKSGRPTNKPIDQFNHGIDALRYLAMEKIKTVPSVRIRSRAGLGF
jgi:phage terminase large subunit